MTTRPDRRAALIDDPVLDRLSTTSRKAPRMGDTSPDRPAEVAHLPVASPPRNHGHTTAAWVTVVLVLIGATVSSLAVMDANVWLFWVGMGVVVVGLVAGRVLKMLGMGQPGVRAPRREARPGS